jgi:hypothetical protein
MSPCKSASAQEVISGGVSIYLEYLANALADLHGYEQERFLEAVPSLSGSNSGE